MVRRKERSLYEVDTLVDPNMGSSGSWVKYRKENKPGWKSTQNKGVGRGEAEDDGEWDTESPSFHTLEKNCANKTMNMFSC